LVLVWLRNNLDPVAAFVLRMLGITAMVAGVHAAGVEHLIGSVALVKGFFIWSLLCTRTCLVHLPVGHRGGGSRMLDEWRSLKCQSGMSSSSSICFEELRRPLEGGRWAVSSASSAISLAEGQPHLFLPAKEPEGRQYCFRSVAMAGGYGSFDVPSGSVPGDGEVKPGRKWRTRSRSGFYVRGPICKVKGLACNFRLLLGPVVICATSLFAE
jgi:hypothetical protein